MNSCTLCPHGCSGVEGKYGRCKVRLFSNGQWTTPFAGCISSTSVDPMEKKPLYHFYPGKMIYSVGFWGCNMKCPFCQNWQISQNVSLNDNRTTPEELIQRVESLGYDFLAFTYNEPLIHFDFIKEASQIAQNRGIKVVLVSNGMLMKDKALELLPYISACNIDLKCFNENIYKSKLGGNLKGVLDFIECANALCHLEITTLLVPGINDNPQEFREMLLWLKRINDQTILHISAYYPSYKYDREATGIGLMKEYLSLAKEELQWVYPGNINLDSSSYCPNCDAILVDRLGYRIDLDNLKGQFCGHCGTELPFIS